MAFARALPIDDGDLVVTENTVVNVDSVPVGDDRDVDGWVTRSPRNMQWPISRSWSSRLFRLMPYRRLVNPGFGSSSTGNPRIQTQNPRRRLVFDEYAVSGFAAAIRTSVPGWRIRKGQREDQGGHPGGRPSRLVGEGIRRGWSACRLQRTTASAAFQQHRLADGIDALGEDDRHRPGTTALAHPPPGFAERSERRVLRSRIRVAASFRIQVNRLSPSRTPQPAFGP